MAPEAERVLLHSFGYELAWIDATFMRDGPDHPAFKMAREIHALEQERDFWKEEEEGPPYIGAHE